MKESIQIYQLHPNSAMESTLTRNDDVTVDITITPRNGNQGENAPTTTLNEDTIELAN